MKQKKYIDDFSDKEIIAPEINNVEELIKDFDGRLRDSFYTESLRVLDFYKTLDDDSSVFIISTKSKDRIFKIALVTRFVHLSNYKYEVETFYEFGSAKAAIDYINNNDILKNVIGKRYIYMK